MITRSPLLRTTLLACCVTPAWVGCGNDATRHCDAAPACDGSEDEVGSCAGRTDCHEVSICGATVFCAPRSQCDGGPACTSGESAVPSCVDRLACRSVTACDETIYCQTNGCDPPPTCVNDYVEVSSCTNLSFCSTLSQCGVSLSCAPRTGDPCTTSSDCPSETYCDFADDLCGAGEATGTCQVREPVCPDSPPVCYCGNVSYPGVEHDLCSGKESRDFNANEGCLGAGDIGCGHLICNNSDYDYCVKSPGGAGRADAVACRVYPGSCADVPMTCDCLASVVADCGGTCADGFNGPTVFCP